MSRDGDNTGSIRTRLRSAAAEDSDTLDVNWVPTVPVEKPSKKKQNKKNRVNVIEEHSQHIAAMQLHMGTLGSEVSGIHAMLQQLVGHSTTAAPQPPLQPPTQLTTSTTAVPPPAPPAMPATPPQPAVSVTQTQRSPLSSQQLGHQQAQLQNQATAAPGQLTFQAQPNQPPQMLSAGHAGYLAQWPVTQYPALAPAHAASYPATLAAASGEASQVQHGPPPAAAHAGVTASSRYQHQHQATQHQHSRYWAADPTEDDIKAIIESTANRLKFQNGKQKNYPHEHVTRGEKQHNTTLGELSISEYGWGLFQIVKDVANTTHDKNALLKHLEEVLDDARDHDWSEVRRWSETVITKVVEDKIPGGWSNDTQIQLMRVSISQSRPRNLANKQRQLQKGPQNVRDGKICAAYNEGKCDKTHGHGFGAERMLHFCDYCNASFGGTFRHPETECRKKSGVGSSFATDQRQAFRE